MTIVGSPVPEADGISQPAVNRDTCVEVRERLQKLFAEALELEVEDVEVDRPFLEFATSSLALVAALQMVAETFEVRPSLRKVFEEFGTIERLAEHVAELVRDLPVRPAPGSRDGAWAGDATVLPLTAAQEELLFLSDLRPEAAPAWHQTVVVEFEGPLHVDALRAAVTALVERHDGLRARLTDDRRAFRIHRDPAATGLTVRELLATSDADRLSQSAEWLRAPAIVAPEETLVRFDLAKFRNAPENHLLRVTAHGLLADRPTVLRLVEELGHLYASEVSGGAGTALRPAGSFAAHQLSEAAAAGDPRRVELAEFWRGRLSPLPVTDLPADHPRPSIKRFAGDRIVVPLQSSAVQNARGETGAIGIFIHVLAAVGAWAARLSGSDDIIIGVFAQPLDGAVLAANRTNPLPIRIAVDDREAFADLKRRVSAAFLDAVDHGNIPFPELVKAVNPDRDQGRSPIFTVSVDREVWPALRFGDLTARIVNAPSPYARYDLDVTLVEGPDFAQLRCDYSTELFDAPTMRRYLAALRRLFEASLADPSAEVGALPLLSSADRARILTEWNRTDLPSPTDEPLFARIDAQAARTPAADAILDGDRGLSYAELVSASNGLANRLRALGVKEEARVAIVMNRSLEAIVAMLGVLKAGGAYVAIDPDYPQARIDYMLADSGADLIIADAGHGLTFDGHATVLALSPGLPEIAGESSERPDAQVRGSSLAYLIYTSGSTGSPKGVAIEHRSTVNLVSWARTAYDDGELSGVLASLSFCFDASVFEIFVPLSWGGTIILARNLFELPTLPLKDRVTLAQGFPSALSHLLDVGLPESIRAFNLGGEAVGQALIDRAAAVRPGLRLLNHYGPSETTTTSTEARLAKNSVRSPSIGRPIGNTRVYVLDRRDEPVPPGVAGELCIAGRGLARGYFGRPEATSLSFVADPFVAGERMYRTGDLARFRDDGDIELIGRRDQQVKLRGIRIELGEIEACLQRHPAVREVVVLAAGTDADRCLVAWTVREPEYMSPHAPDLRAYVREHLPAIMVPSSFVELEALPRLPNGKVDRGGLPAPDTARESRVATEYAAPATDIERTLAAIWCAQLGIERLGRDDDFFALGGHSLLLAPIMIEISRRLGLRVTLSEFFAAPTIAKLAARLHELSRDRLARGRVNRRIARTGAEVDAYFDALRADAVLDSALQLPSVAASVNGASSHLFLTGVTGFVGTYVFYELLRRTEQRFSCLVRSADPAEGRRRIVSSMQRHDLWDDAFADRFSVVSGQLTQPAFGLDERAYDRLTRDCDAVMHLAAQVNFVYPYSALKAVNVGGVHEVLRFCFAGRAKPLHYMSTAAIWPMGAKFRFREDDDLNHGVRLNIGYDDSKWVAEHLVGKARERGLPVTIYRPGEVAGHSVTGRCALDHFTWAIIKGSIQMQVFPEQKSPLDLAPIDYVAAAVAVLSMDSRASGGTYHLNNPSPADPNTIYDLIHEYGYPFTVQPVEDWIATLLARENLSENALYPFAAILEEFEEENFQLPTCDTTRARAALADTAVVCPPVAAGLIRRYLDYLVHVGYLKPPSGA